jgi:hypothetical protein
MAEPLLVREVTAEQVRRLRRQAEAYDALLLRRTAERGDLSAASEEDDIALPGEDDVLIDTALYHAAAERTLTAHALVRRDRLALAGLVLAALGGAAVLIRR